VRRALSQPENPNKARRRGTGADKLRDNSTGLGEGVLNHLSRGAHLHATWSGAEEERTPIAFVDSTGVDTGGGDELSRRIKQMKKSDEQQNTQPTCRTLKMVTA